MIKAVVNFKLFLCFSFFSFYISLSPINSQTEKQAMNLDESFSHRFQLITFYLKPSKSDYQKLDRIIEYLKANIDYFVDISAHSDNSGTSAENRIESIVRGEKIRKYFLDNGVAESRFVINSYGATKPIASNITIQGRDSNNRVEINLSNSSEILLLLCSGYDRCYDVKSEYLTYIQPIKTERNSEIDGPDVPSMEPIRRSGKFKPRTKKTLTFTSRLGKWDKEYLYDLAEYLKENPSASVQIIGHSNNVGTFEENQRYSEDRSEAVVSYLQSLEITIDRLLSRGVGSQSPKFSNDTRGGRKRNNRVDVRVIH